mgnify:CR=1 FL=1
MVDQATAHVRHRLEAAVRVAGRVETIPAPNPAGVATGFPFALPSGAGLLLLEMIGGGAAETLAATRSELGA